MQVALKPGKYVLAVSGGVDSMVLLDVLRQLPGVSLLVAHVDHGIRPDSALDAQLVGEIAQQYGLPFFSMSLELGAEASEALAREVRYQFLETLRIEQGADALVTAHHQDDAIETAILNMARGTGRRGLTALSSTPTLQRPLLNSSKAEITHYAQQCKLTWREDSTNVDQRHLRNYIRHSVVPRFSAEQRQQFVSYLTDLRQLNADLDQALAEAVSQLATNNQLDKQALRALPAVVAKELLTAWWRQNNFRNYETKTVVRAFQSLQRGQSGAIVPLKKPFYMTIGRAELALHKSER